ncbi:MAG: RnfABCDGE type electron transport complex subunit D [Eubacteriales bacterium]
MTDKERRPEANPAPETYTYPPLLTVATSPHMKHKDTTTALMARVILALLPALLWGLYKFGWAALWVNLVSVASCVGFEYLYQKLTRQRVTIHDLSAVVTGLLLGLNVTSLLPLWMAVLAAFFAMVVVKGLFGGIGKNVFNPALAGRAFLVLSYPAAMGKYDFAPFAGDLASEAVDAVAGATPMVALKSGDLSDISLWDMFLGNVPGVIGEISALLLLVGGLYLLVRKVITWHIPVCYLGTVALLTFVFPRGGADNLTFMTAQLLGGGLILGAFFMATDYTTSPSAPLGRIIFGVLCGLLTVFIRYFGAYPEGVSFAILIANSLVFYLDRYARPRWYGAGRRLWGGRKA